MKNNEIKLKKIAHIRSDFPTKFGIPRQSGLIEDLHAVIIFEPEYRNPDALRGIEGYSHLWLLWEFSESVSDIWSPTVRPPRLGGNKRVGVFATRSPFRPNPIGLSAVKLERVEHGTEFGTVLHVSGADLMDQTPIFDIKPYLPFTDIRPNATGGFADEHVDYKLDVDIPAELLEMIPKSSQMALLGILAGDPRPSYQNNPERIYGFEFSGFNIEFSVCEKKLTVVSVTPIV